MKVNVRDSLFQFIPNQLASAQFLPTHTRVWTDLKRVDIRGIPCRQDELEALAECMGRSGAQRLRLEGLLMVAGSWEETFDRFRRCCDELKDVSIRALKRESRHFGLRSLAGLDKYLLRQRETSPL